MLKLMNIIHNYRRISERALLSRSEIDRDTRAGPAPAGEWGQEIAAVCRNFYKYSAENISSRIREFMLWLTYLLSFVLYIIQIIICSRPSVALRVPAALVRHLAPQPLAVPAGAGRPRPPRQRPAHQHLRLLRLLPLPPEDLREEQAQVPSP